VTTPTKTEIYEYAKELWMQDRLRREGSEALEINPTLEELREEGFIISAQHSLMRDPIANPVNNWVTKEKPKTQVYPFAFDWREAQKSNILISGTNSTGKSRLACKLANILKTFGWTIICFDNSSVWREISDIPIFIEICEDENYYEVPILEGKNVIYDISQLIPTQQKELVDFVLLDLWNNRDNQNFSWVMVILEEFELYGRTTRGQIAQNIFRIMHAGRNRQIRTLAVTTDLALIDASFIRLCGLRYHARLNIESNSKRRFRQYYGKEWLEVANSLPLGQFIYLNKNKLQLINVPLFEAKTKPQNYNDYLLSLQPTPQKKKGFWSKVLERLQ